MNSGIYLENLPNIPSKPESEDLLYLVRNNTSYKCDIADLFSYQNYINYNASTNTPPLSSLNAGQIYNVTISGRVTGVQVQGSISGSDSVLLVGDQVYFDGTNYSLVSRLINQTTSIPCGTGGLFTTLGAANTYINQRRLTAVVSLDFNGTATTTETASVVVNHVDGANLQILGTSGGTTFDFSGTSGNNLTISCDCYISAIGAKSSFTFSGAKGALQIYGNVTHDNGITGNNLSTGIGITVFGSLKANTTIPTTIASTSNLTGISTGGIGLFTPVDGVITCYNCNITGTAGGGRPGGSVYVSNNLSAAQINIQSCGWDILGATTVTGLIGNGTPGGAATFVGAVSCGAFAPSNTNIRFNSTLSCTSYNGGSNCQIYHGGNVSNSGTFNSGIGTQITFAGTFSYTGQYAIGIGSSVYHIGAITATTGTWVSTLGQIYVTTGSKPTGYSGTTNTTLGN